MAAEKLRADTAGDVHSYICKLDGESNFISTPKTFFWKSQLEAFLSGS